MTQYTITSEFTLVGVVGWVISTVVMYETNSLLSGLILSVLSIMTEIPEGVRTYHKYLGRDATLEDSGEFAGLVFGILLSSVLSFGISYSTSWALRVTSSTTYSMAGALNKLPIAVAGMLFFSDPVTVGGVSSIIIGAYWFNAEFVCFTLRGTDGLHTAAFAAGIIYSHAKSLDHKPLTSALPAPATAVDQKVSLLRE